MVGSANCPCRVIDRPAYHVPTLGQADGADALPADVPLESVLTRFSDRLLALFETTREYFESTIVIRPTIPADTPALVVLAQETDVFKPHEIQALQEVLDDYHSTYHAHGHKSITHETKGQITGFAYYAPAAMT